VHVPDGTGPGDTVEISERVARRLNRLVCGMYDCQCGEAVAGQDGWSGPWLVSVPEDGEQRGAYPQR
jgi:hypothetical protein